MNTSINKLGDSEGRRNKLVYARQRKKTKLLKDVIERSFSPFPFDWSNVPQGLRTKRKRKFNGKEVLPRPKEALSRPKEKLDSGVFDIYLKKIWKSFSEDRKRPFAYFDSLWFSLYRIASSKDKVLTWIKKEHIFSKAYVFVPIVCWGHWSLLILCHFGESLQSTTRSRCMLLLDSLEMANPKRLEPEVRRFVLDIYKTGDRPETKHLVSQIPFLVPKVPQQRDGNECGFFVLYFINLFLEHAPENFSMEGYPYFMKEDWFTPEGLDRFYERLDSLN
ncbi:ubiquitin-specific protease 2A [Spatholobus suberectus]|nr:ubiquitin-specific protease 2A [Spatholobus suberectus]